MLLNDIVAIMYKNKVINMDYNYNIVKDLKSMLIKVSVSFR